MSDYETKQRKRNIVVGIFVFGGLIAIGWMIFKFGDLPGFVSQIRSYQVGIKFPVAPGVQKDTPVRFCGYQIGQVTHVHPPQWLQIDGTNEWIYQTVVECSIDKQYNQIPLDTEVKLMTRGLGSSYVEFKAKPFDVNEPKGPFIEHGVLLQGSKGMTSEFFPEESQQKLDDLVEGLKSLIANANDIIGNQKNKESIQSLLANLADASAQLSKALESFDQFVMTGTGASEELSDALAQIRQIMQKLNEGKGTASKILNDGRLYEQLLENTEQIKLLLEELKLFVAESKEKGLPLKLK